MSNANRTIWTKRDSKRGIEPVLLARKLSHNWLKGSINTTSVRFSGELLGALSDLRDVANSKTKNLPIASLRLFMQACMAGIITVDKDLGCDPGNSTTAIELHQSLDTESELASKVAELVRKWCMNHLEVWAQKEELGDLAVRVKRACVSSNISITTSQIHFKNQQTGEHNLNLIVKLIADQLAGEELFDGMGACEVVIAEAKYPRNIELMSQPFKPTAEAGGKNSFSMVARVHVSTMPYSSDLYFSVSCTKRVWADKAPDGGNTGRNATGYVMAPGRSVIPVGISKRKRGDVWGWDFDDAYGSLNIEAAGTLPATLEEALRTGYSHKTWWAGLPQITRLYRRVDQHTTLESDEVDLMRTVVPMLAGIVDDELVPMAARRLTLNRKPEQAMLRLTDVGAAGISIADADADSDEFGDDDVAAQALSDAERKTTVEKFQAQCVDVLKSAYANAPIGLWIVGGSVVEQNIAQKAAELLFGTSVQVKIDPLPNEVHNLQSLLPGAELKSRQRFSLRVEAWKRSGLPQAIAQFNGQRFVLICAPKEIDRKSEDLINRRAAIHAICSMAKASVHHVLPIDKTTSPKFELKATQGYIHRLQSAMMDVMLAHSGYVIGAKDFVSDQLDEECVPKAIYGIQALRKQAQRYSGETPVSMIIYSKLSLTSNVTEFNFAYLAAGQTRLSGWQPLSQSLIWLGCQRNIDSDETWLKAEFQHCTIEMLQAIKKDDPKGIFFLDWATLSGLWREITDANLLQGNPRIGHLVLAIAFPGMSFVRIRYGRDAMIPLRSWTKTTYEGFREEASRENTGEYFDDVYAGTVKQLVELNPGDQSANSGHFIGIMGPRSTNQLKRGQSCYRVMVRMAPISDTVSGKKERGVFQKTGLPPCKKDASVSASMDITILHCPDDVRPVDIATLTMGLRVGYAHYPDWTLLPAPLFFIRKIDDYIIKYPLAEAVDEVDLGESAISESADSDQGEELKVESASMRLITGLVQSELQLEFTQDTADLSTEGVSALEASGGSETTESGSEVPEDIAFTSEDVEIVSSKILGWARKTKIVQLYPADSKSRRLFTAMVRGEIKVLVDVPYFVELQGYFGNYGPGMKKSIEKSWRDICNVGFVFPNTSRKPLNDYLDWMAKKLRHPQGAYFVNPRVLFGRALIIPQIHEILETYNRTAKQKISTSLNEDNSFKLDFSPIAKKASDDKDDVTLGWLIFGAAQTPAFGLSASIIKEVQCIPGPRTLAALAYYIQSFTAVKKALDSYVTAASFKPIIQTRAFTPKQEAPLLEANGTPVYDVRLLCEENKAFVLGDDEFRTRDASQGAPAPGSTPDTQSAPTSTLTSTTASIDTIADAAPAAVGPVNLKLEPTEQKAHQVPNRDEFMQIKEESKRLIDELTPGDENFEANVLLVQSHLQRLVELDQKYREDSSRAGLLVKRRTDLVAQANLLIERLRTVDEEELVGNIVFHCEADQDLDAAQAECGALDKLVGQSEESCKLLHECLNTPLEAGAKKSEHIRRAQQVSAFNATLTDVLEQIKNSIDDFLNFDFAQDPKELEPDTKRPDEEVGLTPNPPGTPAHGDALQAAAHVSEAKASEVNESKVLVPDAIAGYVVDSLESQEVPSVPPASSQMPAPAQADSTPHPEVALPLEAALIPEMLQADVAMEIQDIDIQMVVHPEVEAIPAPFDASPKPETEESLCQYDEPPASVYNAVFAPAATKAVAKSVTAPIPAAQNVADPSLTPRVLSSFLTHSENELIEAFVSLRSLITLRHYGLAEVYVDSINSSFDATQTGNHCVILGALTKTLESIDCKFMVEHRLNPELRKLLLQANVLKKENQFTHLGAFAAGFVSALFSGVQSGSDDDGYALWTVIDPVRSTLASKPAISALISLMISRENKGIVLTREKISASRIGPKVAMQAEIERARKRAANWKKDGEINTSWSYQGFARAQDYIFGPKHVIGQCLMELARGDDAALKKLFEASQGKFKKTNSTLLEAFTSIHEKCRPEGPQIQSAIENIEITEKFIRAYLERISTGVPRRDILLEHEQKYVGSLHTTLQDVVAEIGQLTPTQEIERIYVDAAKTIFEAALRLFDEQSGAVCMAVSIQKLLVQQPMDKSLNPSMHSDDEYNIFPLCSGEDVIKSIDELLSDELAQRSSPMDEKVVQRLLAEAQRSHIEQKRFLPALSIEAQLQKGYSKLDSPILQQFQKARADLGRGLQDARQRVTHAMVLSALDQKDANNFLRLIESIQNSNQVENGIGHPEGASSAYPDFPHALAALQMKVISVLDARLGTAKTKQLQALNEYEELKGEACKSDVARIRLMLDTNNPASIRTAHDAFAILRSGGQLPSSVFEERRSPPKEFEEFLKDLETIRSKSVLLESLLTALNSYSPDLPKSISALNAEQRKEASEFIQRWQIICSHTGHEAADLAAQFFYSLGVGKPSFMPERTGRTQIARIEFPDKAFANLANSDCFIPPALGSNAKQVSGFIVPGNSPESEITTLILDITSPTFILSRTVLTLGKRCKMSGQAPVLLIEDNLIAYMALHPEDRSRRMMEIATLSFHTLPYSAEGTFVPREMFFGRQRELISLRAVDKLAILYGGRRLGKSSLLAQIEREENSRSGGMAIYIPMDQDHSGNDHVLFAWKKIAGALASRSVIEAIDRQETDWRKIREAIEHQLMADSQKVRSCYLLFDEADVMMGQELELAADQTGFIRSLQQTAETVATSKFHLRYVIAGLHNLARMTTESNSALGKAEIIPIEPFSSVDDIMRGIELVTKPMAGLGFFFGEGCEDLPLRILSLCNFYPAFIQMYCSKLLNHMYNKRGTLTPWAYITAADLDAVEQDDDLLTELQQKFSWTLDLDKRYKAIALILADYYYSEVETGNNEGLTVAEIRMWCEIESASHFKNMSSGAYEGLVDEMRKLNVLERNGSRYRLRNPSIAMLIGDRERVQMQLKALADAPPGNVRNHGDRRNKLTPLNNSSASSKPTIFPMPIAWTHAYLDSPDSDLVILAGNSQSGLLEVSTNRFDWQITQNDQYSSMQIPASNLVSWNIQLRKKGTREVKGGIKMVMSGSTVWKATDIPQFAANTGKLANSGIKFALAALPDRSYEIAHALDLGSIAFNKDKKAEWSVQVVPPWSLDAIGAHLTSHDNNVVADNDAACKAILYASCGFGRIVQQLCDGNLSLEKALTLKKYAEEKIASDLVSFYTKIGMPIHLIDPDLLKRMEDFMALISGEQRLSASVDICRNDFKLKATDLLFLQWMGLMQEGEGNTWTVPALYLRLLS